MTLSAIVCRAHLSGVHGFAFGSIDLSVVAFQLALAVMTIPVGRHLYRANAFVACSLVKVSSRSSGSEGFNFDPYRNLWAVGPIAPKESIVNGMIAVPVSLRVFMYWALMVWPLLVPLNFVLMLLL